MIFEASLAILGLVCIFLEFFLPGMICAITGILLLLSSISLFFTLYPAIWGVFYLFSLLVLVLCVCKTALWWIKRSKTQDEFYLNKDQEGYLAAQFDKEAIGKHGIAFTELRPSGHIVIDGKHCQALCETGFVEQGVAITVVGGKGGHLIVKKFT